jgi:hypothetical protein
MGTSRKASLLYSDRLVLLRRDCQETHCQHLAKAEGPRLASGGFRRPQDGLASLSRNL